MITKIFPYLNFEGTGKDAAHFYTEALNAELAGITTYGDAHAEDMGDMPEDARDLVMNAQIILPNGETLMISDIPPGMGMSYQKGNNISVTVTLDNIEEATAVFGKLAHGGVVSMELQETFWSPLYGSLIDRYGIEWQISVDAAAE